MESKGAVLALFGGPAGAGKSTLAAAWCATRDAAVHLQLDAVRELIVSGRADPQLPSALAGDQYQLSVRATLALARVFLAEGYDVAIDDVLEPAVFERGWRPLLDELDWRLVIIRPSLAETLTRSAAREKRVLAEHTRAQHEATGGWPASHHVDTTGLSAADSLALVRAVLGWPQPPAPSPCAGT